MATAKMKQEIKKNTIIKDGSIYRMFGDVGLISEFPNVVLEVKFNPLTGLYLEEGNSIYLPEKIYSNDKNFIKHALTSYKNCQGSLGILLSGSKGLGKSFTANVLCQNLGLPVIKITQKLEQTVDLFGFLNKIKQEHIIFIDEFEKIFMGEYDRDENSFIKQTDFLSFLDSGSINTKRLFIITANERVSDYLMNRPSRLRYHRRYNKMELSVIKEIVNDLLVNRDFEQDLIENIPQKDVNIDVLIKIIEEVNLHNKPYTEFKDFFNFQSGSTEYVTIQRENGATVMEDVLLSFPIKVGHTLFCDEKSGNDVDIEEILSETYLSVTVRTEIYNENYRKDKTVPEYIEDVYVVKRQNNHLF